MCTYDDYMKSRSTLPHSTDYTDIATELTKHQDYDPSTMPRPPQGPYTAMVGRQRNGKIGKIE